MPLLKTNSDPDEQESIPMEWASMPREDFDWSDLCCPQCGDKDIFVRVLKLNTARSFTKKELAQAIAAGVVVEDDNYYLQDTICCITCNTATKFTQPDDTWAPNPN